MNDRGVPESGFQSALEAVTGSSFQAFFDDHINGMQDVDWAASVSKGGFALEKRASTNPTAWLRVYLGDGVTILDSDPAGNAVASGLKNGDTFLKVGGSVVSDQVSFEAAFAAYAPGDVASVIIQRDGVEQEIAVEVHAGPIRFYLEANDSASRAEAAIRESWMANPR